MGTGRTLIVSGSEEGLNAVIGFVKRCGCQDVCVVSSGDEARRSMQQDSFDLLMINTPLKDEFGYHLAMQMSESTSAGVILICKQDMAEEMMNQTIDAGVSVVPKPINKALFHQAIRLGFAMRSRLQGMKRENARLQSKLEELRYVSRAKCVLIETQSMTELQAHRYIEKQAMDTRRPRKEVALEIIAAYDAAQDV
ncbi:MAG: ANTAR domain-containing response regulator [Ruminococcus sp.]